MPDLQKLIDDVKFARDETELRIHLASMEAQEQWDEFEKRWHEFSSKAELQKSGRELNATLKALGSELKDAYVRLSEGDLVHYPPYLYRSDHMKVRDLMHKGVEIMPPETTVAKLAMKMRKLDVGAIPIGSNEELVGMVTDRDITVRAVANGKDISPLTAQDVMTKDVFCCRDTARVKDVVQMMEEKKIRRVPVTDEADHVVGMVSLGDISGAGKMIGEVMKAVSAHHA